MLFRCVATIGRQSQLFSPQPHQLSPELPPSDSPEESWPIAWLPATGSGPWNRRREDAGRLTGVTLSESDQPTERRLIVLMTLWDPSNTVGSPAGRKPLCICESGPFYCRLAEFFIIAGGIISVARHRSRLTSGGPCTTTPWLPLTYPGTGPAQSLSGLCSAGGVRMLGAAVRPANETAAQFVCWRFPPVNTDSLSVTEPTCSPEFISYLDTVV